MRVVHVGVCLTAAVPMLLSAQQFLPGATGTPVDPNIRFEVVVIRPIEDASTPLRMMMTPGGFESAVPIGILVRQALQKPDYQIAGAPGWINTERYSIRAKAPEGTPQTATPVLLLNLLKDRFGLVTHLETRELAVSHLVLARADGRLGPDLKPTPAECQATITERQEAAKRGVPPPMPPSLPGPNDPLPCGFQMIGFGTMRFSAKTVAQLLPPLSDFMSRPVIDKTGLTGLWDASLTYAFEGRVPGPLGALALPPGFQLPATDPNAPSLGAALQEQLGLKLENARGPVEVAVIDKLETPTLD